MQLEAALVAIALFHLAGVANAQPSQLATRAGGQQFMLSGAPPALMAHDDAPAPPSPCDDPLFKRLQQKSLDSLTTREYEYFKLRDKECSESRRGVLTEKPVVTDQPVGKSYGNASITSSPSDDRRKGMDSSTAVLFGIVGTCAFLLLISALASAGG